MDETMIALDRIASMMTPQSKGCGCARCRAARFDEFEGFEESEGFEEFEEFEGFDAMEAARRRKARAKPPRARGRVARGGTTARATARQRELRTFKGWTPAVTLAQIQAAQKQARAGKTVTDPVMRRMLAKGGQVYRVTRAGIDRDRALTIGATMRTGTIADRIDQHHTSAKRGDKQVWQAIHNLHPGQIYVQAGIITDRDRHNRRTKLYENLLQVRERPLLYNRDTTTFEEAAARRGGHDGRQGGRREREGAWL